MTHPEDVLATGGIAPRILNLDTRWLSGQIQAPSALPREMRSAVPVRPRSWSERGGEANISCRCQVGRSALSPSLY
jgi:hypothetical protein